LIHKEIIEGKKARFKLQELNGSGKIARLIFSPFESPANSIRNLGSLLLLVSEQLADLRKLESLLISEAVKTLNVLSDSFEELVNAGAMPEISAGFVLRTIRRSLSGLTVPFDGEPLSGLQVMGLLESRCLDFDELIVLGMNEGVLPKVSITPSFIPDNVRRAFALPVLENQNSIFAYFFYRLLHCAKKVTLIYVGITDDKSGNGGEASRFIKQLEFETSCKFTHVLQQNQSIETPAIQGIEVIKDGPVLDKLQSYLKRNPEIKYDKKISASSFTDYVACPLKFFFSKIAGLAEPKDMPDEIGPHTVGTMLHSVMESFYHDSLGKEVTAEYIRQREKLLPAMSKAAMIKELKLNPDYELQQSALQQIVIRVIEQYALKVLRHDEQIAPFVIKELEDRDAYTPLFSIEVEGREEQVRLMGIIDRVDIHQGKIRIVDYKTGKDQLKYGDFEGLFNDEGKGQNKALLQTLFYTIVYEKTRNLTKVEPHLYTVKDFSNGTQFIEKTKDKLILKDENLAGLKDQFAKKLKEKLNELFDSSVPFRQTENIDNCKYCSFNGICQR
jgi:CRISPR/Cas system-associated exonuclease Cas4 (RecB family)